MNWYNHGLSSKRVGFIQEGQVCEGGNCEHLQEGDAAHGQTSEHDSMGSEVYLMCKACYEEFLVGRQQELLECHDCHGEFPRNKTRFYKAYDSESIESEIFRADICLTCWNATRHQTRLARDSERAEEDRLAIYGDDNDDVFDYDCDDDLGEDPTDWDLHPNFRDIMDGKTVVLLSGHNARNKAIVMVKVSRRKTLH